MSFNPIAALNVLECRNIITNDSPKAIDLGCQTPAINKNFISNILKQNLNLNNNQKKI